MTSERLRKRLGSVLIGLAAALYSLALSELIQAPLALLFNRAGVYISMTHILLPFMIFPLIKIGRLP